ncbi:MAG: endonuclease MutS2 [Cyanobacteria bacterium WB6_1B_304]|nr:endonuclease MutS2 [Cyanobacteria bacterium WB6_1B_304]
MIQTETLNLLEWQRLCDHLSTFASTPLGISAAHSLQIPEQLSISEALLTQTEEIYGLETRLASGLTFHGIVDIRESLERGERGGILGGEELLAIATTLAGVRNLRRVIDHHPDFPCLNALVADIRTYPELEQQIHHCIDEQGQVNDRASPKLGDIRDRLRRLRNTLYQSLQRILARHGNAIQEPIITQREGRFVIPVKSPQKDAIPGIVHDASSSGATLYIEPQSTVGFNNQMRQLRRQEEGEEEVIRQALTNEVGAVKSDLDHLLAVATVLDLGTARARYSLWLGANKPRFIPWCPSGQPDPGSLPPRVTPNQSCPSPITLRQLRHPLLEWQHRHEQGEGVVPVDLMIQPHIRVVAITGPNTGGKTVTLKTLGLAVLMAKAGIYVPAREPVELPWFSQVLADIGDEQSLQQSLSTFSGHIRRIGRILNALPPPPAAALILLDEVGAGTDPTEGSALAIALLQYLADHAGLTLATTHFGELKALKYQDSRFENASVEFDESTLSPTYRLMWGIPGRSNAFTIAQRLGLIPAILEQAKHHLTPTATQDVNQIIAGLEAERRKQEQRAKEATQLLAETERLYGEVLQKNSLLQKREQDLRLLQEQSIQQAIGEARAEIAKVIRKLQQGPATAQAAQIATTMINQIAENRLSPLTPPVVNDFRPQPGDRVRIPRINQVAEVIAQSNEDGQLTVRLGLMKMTVGFEDVESLDGQKATLPIPKTEKINQEVHSHPIQPQQLTMRTSANTLDLRGSRVADAELELERAIAHGNGCLWIIHGHGTGKLRMGVQEFLRHHPQISHFEMASQSDGGSGVTIAYLK